MDFELILSSIGMIINSIIAIIFVVVLLKEKKWWGLVIILFIGICCLLLDKFEYLFEEFLDEGFNNASWLMIGIFFIFTLIMVISGIFTKADDLYEDKLQKKKYMQEQIKNMSILILGGLLILGTIVVICSIK